MPSSKKTPKKRVEAGDKESSTETNSNAAQVGESSIALMQQMFQHMQHQAEEDRERQREDREQQRQDRERQAQREEEMRNQMQELMERMRVNEERRENRSELVLTEALEKLQASRETATPTTHTGGGTRSKKLDVPVLGPVESTRMADFRTWKESFQGYANVLKLKDECDLTGRRTMLRTALDPTWQKLWTTQILGIGQDDDMAAIIEHIGEYIRRKRNPLLDRHDFHRRNQHGHETVDQYMAELKILYESCNFQHEDMTCECGKACKHNTMLREEALRDRLIFGLKDPKVREKVFEVPLDELSLDKAYKIIQAMESSKATLDCLSEEVHVDKIFGTKQDRKKSTYKQNKMAMYGQIDECTRCGRAHEAQSCPAKDRDCNHCGKKGHYEKCCLIKKNQDEQGVKTLHSVQVHALKKVGGLDQQYR